MNNYKRITIQSGDYVLLSDIPNEQVFNLVKECFVNAGFIDNEGYYNTNWESKRGYLTIGVWCDTVSDQRLTRLFYTRGEADRQLSLSDVFNSTNGKFDWNRNTTHVGKFNTSRIKWVYTVVGAEMITLEKIFDYEEKPNTYKISRLWNLNNLERTDVKLIEGRATGKSTAHHLELISKAMKSPEQWVKVTNDDNSTMWGTILAGNEIKRLCEKLGLDWMEFDNNNQRIRYMPYQTVKMVTKWEVIA